MNATERTHVTPLQVKRRDDVFAVTAERPSTPDWQTIQDLPPKRSLLKNTAVAAALVLCAVTLRTGAVPSLTDATDAVLTAATDQSLLDEQLGKLSFVSSLFPEAVLVFGESTVSELAVPVSGGVVIHAWSSQEPYTTFRTSANQVFSSGAGEVTGIYHGNDDERLVQVSDDDGFSCLYGNMQDIYVQLGDAVSTGSTLGTILPGEDLVFEVRHNGVSIDPARCFPQ